MTAFDTAWDLVKMPFHGTDIESAEQIMMEGLMPQEDAMLVVDGETKLGDFSFASDDMWEAETYAKDRGHDSWDHINEGAIIHISPDFKPFLKIGSHSIYNKPIPPEFLKLIYSTIRGDLK